jgi:hypothetical protein
MREHKVSHATLIQILKSTRKKKAIKITKQQMCNTKTPHPRKESHTKKVTVK